LKWALNATSLIAVNNFDARELLRKHNGAARIKQRGGEDQTKG